MISLGIVDWSIVAGYCVLAIGIGAWMSRRATRNVDEYFVAGRSLPWWVAGTSMVATSFAADTPLAISQIVRTQGLQGN
jgi:Na+/proline symporter